jgi:hypothetical protein
MEISIENTIMWTRNCTASETATIDQIWSESIIEGDDASVETKCADEQTREKETQNVEQSGVMVEWTQKQQKIKIVKQGLFKKKHDQLN